VAVRTEAGAGLDAIFVYDPQAAEAVVERVAIPGK